MTHIKLSLGFQKPEWKTHSMENVPKVVSVKEKHICDYSRRVFLRLPWHSWLQARINTVACPSRGAFCMCLLLTSLRHQKAVSVGKKQRLFICPSLSLAWRGSCWHGNGGMLLVRKFWLAQFRKHTSTAIILLCIAYYTNSLTDQTHTHKHLCAVRNTVIG